MTQPQVVIASGGVFHAYHMARAAQQAGLLKRFITRVYNRYEHGIDRQRVVQVPLAWALAFAIGQLPGSRAKAWSAWVGDTLFDQQAARHVAGADIYHVFNNYGYHSLPAAKAQGAITVVERSSAHPAVQQAILEEEFTRHGLQYPAAYTRLNARVVAEYELADYIMVCSDFVRQSMLQQGIAESKLLQVHLGFAPERFQPGTKQDDVFRVLYAGSISLQKGIQYLLAAFARLNLPNSELLLVGRVTPDAKAVMAQYAGHYRQVDFVPQADLPAYYQQASAFVLPSLQDGFGMVVYEAAACGLPVLITENVGADIREGVDGFRVPIRNPEALAEKLAYWYTHPTERAAMGQAAHSYVQQFTWANYHRELVDHYQCLWNEKLHAG